MPICFFIAQKTTGNSILDKKMLFVGWKHTSKGFNKKHREDKFCWDKNVLAHLPKFWPNVDILHLGSTGTFLKLYNNVYLCWKAHDTLIFQQLNWTGTVDFCLEWLFSNWNPSERPIIFPLQYICHSGFSTVRPKYVPILSYLPSTTLCFLKASISIR
jgi:hypothetical protein